MTRLVEIQPMDFSVTKGARATFGEAVASGFGVARETGSLAQSARHSEVYGGWRQVIDGMVQGTIDAPAELKRSIYEQGFAPDEDTLTELLDWAQREGSARYGFPITDDMDPATVAKRREDVFARDTAAVNREQEVLSRASPFDRAVGGMLGGIGAEFLDPINIATLPLGAPARAGFLATMLGEAAINAAIEAADTPNRNAIARSLGQEETSALENAALGAVFGGGFVAAAKGASVGGRLAYQHAAPLLSGGASQIARLGRLIDRRPLIKAADASGDPEVQYVARQLLADLEDEAAGGGGVDASAAREHLERATAAAVAAHTGGLPAMPDRPTFTAPRASILNGEIEEVDPRGLLVQPEVFQFKSEIVEAGGVTPKLLKVTEWRPERAGVSLVYEYADGSRAVADGHQRRALAVRLMDQTGQDIRLAARVFRETDGYSVDDVRVLAALKNIAEAADGMTAAMAGDAARVLRIRPEAIADLPAGPGIARAKSLARLSDEAFDMFINEVVPERFAELVGKMVENPAMHAAMMRLLQRTGPETAAQAESILSQAMQAPVSREVTTDLFGDQEVIESLYIERAKVLERAMRIMRDDRSIFRTLDERAARIQGTGSNRLDTATNRQTRQMVEQALVAVQRLAHRAGPISEALNDGAKGYRDNGRLQDAAQRVADAVRGEIERNGLSGAGAGVAGRAAEPARAGAATPDPLEGFSDPVNGAGVKAQIAATRLDANERPADTVSDDLAGRAQVAALIDRGAAREEIDSHPVVVRALEQLAEAAANATTALPGFGREEWHRTRVYSFDGERVIGTMAAVPGWVRQAKAFARGEVRNEAKAVIILGPPAAGKSSIAEHLAEVRGAAILDADEIKKTLPEFRGGIGAAAVHEESSALSDLLEAVLRGERANIIFPKVGSNPASIRKAIARFKNDGYAVEIVNMAVTTDNAYRRMIRRFATTGRIIPPQIVYEVGETPSATYRILRDEAEADGFVEIDNNGDMNAEKPITDRAGSNPLAGSRFDLSQSGRARNIFGNTGAAGDGSTTASGGGQAEGLIVERTSAGFQGLFEGVAPITDRQRLAQRAAAPMGAGRARRDDTQIGGLFDPNDPGRFDLFDAVPIGRGFDAEGREMAIVKTRAEMAAELDADDWAVEVIDTCLKG